MLFRSILTNHDSDRFDVVCYDTRNKIKEFTKEGFNGHWVQCGAMSLDQLNNRIRSDNIDILIDLTGHNANSSLPLLSLRPAPIQMTYLGFPGSSGLTEIDYRLTDQFADPIDDVTDYYSEKLLRLPHSIWCYRPLRDAPPITSLPALSNGYITFGSLNTFFKLEKNSIDLWAKIL